MGLRFHPGSRICGLRAELVGEERLPVSFASMGLGFRG